MLGFLSRQFARLGQDVRSQSEAWKIRCDACGRERSLAEAGGVRWGAYGRMRTLGFCSACRRLRTLTIHHPTRGPL